MILSMTGYGQAQYKQGAVSYSLEIRSLNNRYFKAQIRLPEHLLFLEADVERMLRRRLGRGSINYQLRTHDAGEAACEINTAALSRYLAQLRTVISPDVQIDAASLLELPGVCQTPEMSDEDRRRHLEIAEQLTDEAVERLIEMRRVEGQALSKDLRQHCDRIRTELTSVAARAPEVIGEYHRRLGQRAGQLLAEAKLDLSKDDLAREVALFADRSDISEEISRLGSHLDQFVALCDSQELAGRKLDFLTQEMLREANTIASKANDAGTSARVVEIKGLIDRLREQVQNVE